MTIVCLEMYNTGKLITRCTYDQAGHLPSWKRSYFNMLIVTLTTQKERQRSENRVNDNPGELISQINK